MNNANAMRYFLAICLIIATINHLVAALKFGFLWDYGYGEQAFLVSRLFWGSLTFLDPLAAYLLIAKPKAGIASTLAIITVDVLHNGYYVYLNHQWLEPFFVFQCAFLVISYLFAVRIKRKGFVQARQ